MEQTGPDRQFRRWSPRRAVAGSAEVKDLQPGPDNEISATTKTVRILDVSLGGAALGMGFDPDAAFREVFDLGVGGAWATVQVVWWAWRGVTQVLVCGVKFLEPDPEFVATLDGCFGLPAYIRPALDRAPDGPVPQPPRILASSFT